MTYSTYETLAVTMDNRGVVTLELARPQVHNAMNDTLIAEMRDVINKLGTDAAVRCVVLTGQGKSFCAGGDIGWFAKTFDKTRAQRVWESGELARMLHEMDTLPKPLIGRINGPAYGGGVGMISVCDITIGIASARFGLTEVRLGLIPANISPYVVRRMGVTNARRTFLSGALFNAERAHKLNLLDELVDDASLDQAVEIEIEALLQAAPGAASETKRLIAFVNSHGIADNMIYTADRLADAWETEEGQMGVRCFLEKTAPPWRNK